MAGRHQMLRHIDCAWEIRARKKVFGFFIVEGSGDSIEIPREWLTHAEETVSETAIAASLPHRGPDERNAIATTFLGVTTWQRVCDEFKDLKLHFKN